MDSRFETVQSILRIFIDRLTSNLDFTTEEDHHYQSLRRAAIEDPTLSSRLPRYVKDCRSLSEIWPIMSQDPEIKNGSWAARRGILYNAFNPLLDELDNPEGNADTKTYNDEDIRVSQNSSAMPLKPLTNSHDKHYDSDIVIVCALTSPELSKVKATVQQPWKQLSSAEDDPHTYHEGMYSSSSGRFLRVIAGAPTQPGMQASGVLAAKMIMKFRPRVVAMIGIAAGANSDSQGFGDILIANNLFDYGAGKILSTDGEIEFRPDPNPIAIDTRLHHRLNHWKEGREELDAIFREWPAKKPRTFLNVHIGPLGSGGAVVAHKVPVQDIALHWRKLVGIEMEAYAVAVACRDTREPRPMFICMKSVCDFADSMKNDDWQDYAAYTAAQYFKRFISREWDQLQPNAT